jgi:hypothetical protein
MPVMMVVVVVGEEKWAVTNVIFNLQIELNYL